MLTKSDRELAESMLRDADAAVRRHYDDPNLHAVDWQDRVQEAQLKVFWADYSNMT